MNTDEHPWTGSKIGNLEVLERVGDGASACVLLAREEPSGRQVAMKVLTDELCADKDRVEEFISEARRAARLKHKNILRIFRIAVYRDRYFMVSEYAGAGSLQDLIDDRGRVPLKKAVDAITQAADGLAFAAAHGMVHRDVKPANLLITADDVVKVSDFGIAGKTGERTSDGAVIFGSPHYISPEQARGEPVTEQSDIYSLGATFYHAVTGRTPFKDQKIPSLLLCHATESPPPANKVVPTIPRRVSEVIETMMARDPVDRYQNFYQALSDLDELREMKSLDKMRFKRK